jgi:hypothetical protein
LALCPPEIASNSSCLNDTSWLTLPGWRTNLTTSYRRATIAYTWTDDSVLSYTFSDATADPAPIDASDLLQAFDKVMMPVDDSSALGQALSMIGLGSNKPVMPFYVCWYFQEFGDLAKASESAQRRAMTAFQSLLSIPIYHCQVREFQEISSLKFNNIPIGQLISSLLLKAQADTLIVPAKMNHSIAVGLSSLIPFIVIGGVTLLLCFITLFLSSCTSAGRRAKDTTAFPTIDHRILHQLQYESGGQVTEKNCQNLQSRSEREKLREVATWRVMMVSSNLQENPAITHGDGFDLEAQDPLDNKGKCEAESGQTTDTDERSFRRQRELESSARPP